MTTTATMAEPPRRSYHHGNLHEALLGAAEAMLEARGVQDLSLRELGRGLGVSHTSARRHFADKRALLDTLAHRGFERLGRELGEAAADCGRDFDARLLGLARAHLGFALRHPALFRWMFESMGRPNAPAALLAASEVAFLHASAVLEAGQAAGAVVAGDPEQLGLASFAAVQGLVALSSGGRFGGVPLDELLPGVLERIVLGLRPRP